MDQLSRKRIMYLVMIISYIAYVIITAFYLESGFSSYGDLKMSFSESIISYIFMILVFIMIATSIITILTYLLSPLSEKIMKYRKNVLKMCIIIYFLVIPPYISVTSIAKNYENKTYQAGNAIVNALEDYKKEKGDYPDNLGLLVPDYMNHIPKTAKSKDFVYEKINKTYRLYFLDYFARYEYHPDVHEWLYHD